jgi:hypothetical protein
MMSQAEIPERFVRFALAVVESPMLRSWFYKLEAIPERDRAAWLLDMARHVDKEDQDLAITAFQLRDPKIYRAVLAAIRDRVGDADRRT